MILLAIAIFVVLGIMIWFLAGSTKTAPIGQLRVIAYTRMEPQYGYVGRHPRRYQELQRMTGRGWMTIDVEQVPEWEAAYNAVGGSGWQSSFRYAGTWGRDGIVTPHV